MKERLFTVGMMAMALVACGALAGCSAAGRADREGDSDSVCQDVADSASRIGKNGYRGPTHEPMPLDKTVSIFGVTASGGEVSIIRTLEANDILKVDTINMEWGEFRGAVVEFAGVKFGLNRGFLFITSRHDRKAVKMLVDRISEFYGEPDIDGDPDDPEYCYYHWNNLPGEEGPSIMIRPLHSEEGGLTMMWDI